MKGAINGLNNLHNKAQFAHRDINIDNILIAENATAILSDFSNSSVINPDDLE
jgi:serine/threonine protein kinase